MNETSYYPGDPVWVEHLRKMHPFKLFIRVAMVGIGIMFLFLSVGFLRSPTMPEQLTLPYGFSVSAIVLLLSSLTLYPALIYYRKDDIKKLHYSLIITFLLGLLFIALQMAAWKQLFESGVYFNKKVEGSYLFLLSGLHLAHFFGGLIFFLVVFFRVLSAFRDAVKCLVYVTDPYEKMLLELLCLYWHFMDALWVALYVVMWIKMG